MPTYEYRCNACKREFEAQQKMSDPDLTTCEACGADKLERLISWTAIRTPGWEQGLYSANPAKALRSTMDSSRAPAKAEPAATTAAAEPSPAATSVTAEATSTATTPTAAVAPSETASADAQPEDEDKEDETPSNSSE
jgi:putative FmdB family regulatory protein